jgi:hypothetical protein
MATRNNWWEGEKYVYEKTREIAYGMGFIKNSSSKETPSILEAS